MRHEYDLVIVGLGSGGIVASQFASRIGLQVAAVERARVGGDCLWTGCVPSKAVIAAARTAHTMRTAARVGITAVEPEIDLAEVWARMRSVQERIAATDDNPDTIRAMGVEVIEGEARVAGPHAVEVAGRTLDTRFVLLCTGSRPSIPPIAGLEDSGYLTSESLFALERPPRSLAVIGGGPVGVEIAQASRRLGIEVTLIEQADRLLPNEEPQLVERLTGLIEAEGVAVRCPVRIAAVSRGGRGKLVHLDGGAEGPVSAGEIFVATGRSPTVDGLGLEAAGVGVSARGVEVDSRLRTSVRSIYAAGDVAGRFWFTHSAGHEAAQAVRNMFFPRYERAVRLVPWCTFTDPELAHVGLTAAQARARHGGGRVEVHELGLERSDRARTDAEEEGAIVLVTVKGRLLGGHALAPAAGELIHELALAIGQRARLRDLSALVHVYPTRSTSIVMLAAEAAFERARRYSWLIRRR